MTKEIVAVVNDKDEVISSKELQEVHKLGLFHREVFVYLINDKKEVLLQKRADEGVWDHSAAGHFSLEESYLMGAIRELYEEIGLKVSEEELKEIGYEFFSTIKKDRKNLRFGKIFLVQKNVSLTDLRLDSNEVLEVKFFKKEELKQLKNIKDKARYVLEKYIFNLIK